MDKESIIGSNVDGSSGRNTPRSLNQDGQRRDTPGPVPTYQYSREQLFELSDAPASKIRPSCLSKEFDSSDGIWDPERWGRSFGGGSRGPSPLTINDAKERRPDLPRRQSGSLDPREKLLHEEDGIVLSPQRRSFGTGCHVTHPSMGRQISCPADLQDRERDRRDHRRIGSGRIQIDRDREAPRERDRDFRNPRDRFEREDRERDRRFDRDRDRSFRQRDFEERRDYRDRGFTREISRRRNSYRHDEEPEWFTGGPASQTEMIELHGFDKVENHSQRGTPVNDLVHEKDKEKQGGKEEPYREKNNFEELEDEQRGDEVEECVNEHEDDVGEIRQKDKKYEGIHVADRNGSLETNESSSPETNTSDREHRRNTSPTTSSLFDFNEFFKLDYIPGLNDFPAELDVQSIAGSRFYQLFKMSTSGSQGNSKENSRRSSLNEEFGYLNDLLNGSRSPIIPSPPPTSANTLFECSSIFHSLNTSLGEKQTSTFDFGMLQKGGNMNPLVSALLNNALAAEKQSRSPSVNISTQDAEAQLKALIFGRSSGTPSSSGTASPGFSSPLNGRVKTLAEIEGDFTMPQPDNGLSSTMKNQSNVSLSTPPPNFIHNSTSHQSGSMVEQQEEGDLTAFNKLISLMKAGAATPVESPKFPLKSEIDRPMSPITSMMPLPVQPMQLGSAAQNEFIQALQRNKEQQLHIRQQTLEQMRYQNHLSQQRQPSPVLQTTVSTPIQQPIPQTAPPPHSHQPPLPAPTTQTQSTHSPIAPQAVLLQRRLSQGDPIMNFIKQNPTIITKPASPTPPLSQQTLPILNSTTHGPSPSPIMQQPTLLSQQPPSSPRVPSPIMFGQQPPMHLSAPSPIHPSQRSALAQSPTGQPTTLTTTATIRPPSVPRVPSPQELIAHTQAILQNALIKRQLEDQKERFYKRQQERGKSPNPQGATAKTVAETPITSSSSQTKTSVSAAFTPTSVIRKMHSEKACEKEKQKQEKQDGISDEKNSVSNQKPPPVMQLVNMDFMDKLRDNKEQISNAEKAQQTYHKSVPVSAPEKSNPSIQQGTSTWSTQQGGVSQMFTSASWTLTSPSVLASLSSQVSKHNILSTGNQPVSVSQMMQMPPPPLPVGTLSGQNMPGSQEQADKKQQLLRALMGQGNMQTGIPIQIQTIATSLQTPGRPIVKGISNVNSMSTSTPTQSHTPVQLPQMMTTPISKLDQTPFQQRAIMGIATSTPVASNMDFTKVLQQQQQTNRAFNPTPNLQSRSVGNMTPNTPYGIPITGRMPVQTPPVPVHPATANVILMQQMLQQQQSANTSRANTLNHLAAIQAQHQRMLDSRFQGAVRGMYAAGVVPQMLSPRGVIGNPSVPGSMGTGLGRSFSPHIAGPKSSINGPVSPSALTQPVVTSAASFISGNNNLVGGGEQANLLKWFGSDVLKTQLPNLPPLPHQGQRVMTVDEIERI
ncbi:hypothetical protein CHS0354_022625 [Potamilus streckersoni]|uniref:Eukaryotic translation initiation factor 4E transporter n=1 Tax=Potamilus streckersoni TaxID=2493646 RepID=A0AAE0WCN0_9BIVA|nr:hypothetical protein CHS0354_022625 [Potamilus streckersoni]